MRLQIEMRIILVLVLFAIGMAVFGAAWAQGEPVPDPVSAFILAHPLLTYTVAMTLGAAVHWFKRWRTGEAPGNPLDYWLFDKTPNGVGALGSLVAAFFLVWGTDALEGVTPQFLLMGAWGVGWTLDSAINRSSEQPPRPST